METIQALQYKYDLNRYINQSLKLGRTYSEIWEALVADEYQYNFFADFLTSRIGLIWLKKDSGQDYLAWQHGETE